MLNTIKAMINQKKDFLEAAELILEDAITQDIDDEIILGEDEVLTEEDDHEFEDHDDTDEIPANVNSDEQPEETETNDNIMDSNIDDKQSVDNSENDDIMAVPVTDGPVEEPMNDDPTEPVVPQEVPASIPGDDTLPEPVSNVTGEPVADDGILSMELDLGTNTPKDVLPVPPANAGDAVVSDDMLGQRIDSGFGGNDSKEPTEGSIASISSEDVDDLLSEAITIADPVEEKPEEGSASEEVPATETPVEDNTTVEEPVAEEPTEEDNEVTAAVKDKVAEAESPAYDGDSEKSKEELLKKLGSMTKSLEDIKRAVMSAI